MNTIIMLVTYVYVVELEGLVDAKCMVIYVGHLWRMQSWFLGWRLSIDCQHILPWLGVWIALRYKGLAIDDQWYAQA